MYFQPDNVYHIYNRGNNKRLIFFKPENHIFFLNKIKTQLSPVCEMLCWCLMPNHFHFMIYATAKSCEERKSFGGKPMQELAYRIGILLSSYSQAINKQNNTTGSLFQQKTKAKLLSDDPIVHDASTRYDGYMVTCMHYIHQNAWKAGLVTKMEDWLYSSFIDYINNRNDKLCNKELLFSLTDLNSNCFYKESYNVLPEELLREIF